MSEPHPLRCETCDHNITDNEPDSAAKRILIENGAIRCKVIGRWVYKDGTGSNYLDWLGCASHSAAPKQGDAEQRIRDVITEIEEARLTTSLYEVGERCAKAIALLRKE